MYDLSAARRIIIYSYILDAVPLRVYRRCIIDKKKERESYDIVA